MTILGLTVCVDYADRLATGLPVWRDTLDGVVVVTTPSDGATFDLCTRAGVGVHRTNLFYRHGARFNKGAALADAYAEWVDGTSWAVATDLWVLFFDADVTPPPNWRRMVEAVSPTPGILYGCLRHDAGAGKPVNDADMAGFFHLFSRMDRNAAVRPIVDTHWYHAGNYDSTFQDRWARADRVVLPISLAHAGPVGENWCGVGNAAAVRELHAERRRRGGRWNHETIEGVR